MAVGLSAVGVLKYNNVTFDGASQAQVNVEYIQDEAERTVMFQRVVITVRAIIAGANGTDAEMQAIRLQLSQQGQELVFINRGFGADFVVNPVADYAYPQTYKDVRWGPKPKILHWEPIGSNKACEIEWQVETCFTFCSSTPALLALNYQASYQIDARGMTTRTISGHYLIAQTRNGRAVPQSADELRAQIAINLPYFAPIASSGYTWEGIGFQRTSQWSTSLDKSREDFTITDRQIPSNHAYPDYAVNVRGRHRTSWRKPGKGNHSSWIQHSISMDMELADGINPALSFLIFSNIVNTRIAAANKDENGATVKRTQLMEVSIEEDLFGRVSSFHLSYRVLGGITGGLSRMVTNSGLWASLGTAWQTWANSMATVFSAYGPTGIKNIAANDSITDLCGRGTTSALANGNLNLPANPTLTPIYPTNVKPDPKYSYGNYQSAMIPYSDTPVVRQSILQAPVADSYAQTDGGDMVDVLGFKMPSTGGTNDILQESGTRRYGMKVVGFAERYGYEVPRPSYSQVGTASDIREISNTFSQRIVSNNMGVPLYRAEWVIDYALPNSPTAVHPPKNYEQGIESNGTLS